MPDNTYVVIDLETPKIVKRTDNFRAASLWADTDFAMKSTHVSDLSPRAFSCLTEFSLIKLYKNTFNEDLGLRPYGEMLKACYYKALELPIDDTSVQTLEVAHKHAIQGLYPLTPSDAPPLPPVAEHPTDGEWRAMAGVAPPLPAANGAGKANPPAAHRAQPSPATRPKPGTTTAKVWDICDAALHATGKSLSELDVKEFRAAVMKLCEKEGINESTSATQYGKWKASQGAAA